MEYLYAILLIVGFILTACCAIVAVSGKTCNKLWYMTMAAYIAYGVCASVALKDWRQIGVGFLFVCACYATKIAWNALKAKIKHEKYSAKTNLAIFAATLVLFIVGMMLPYDKVAEAQRTAEAEARALENAASSAAAASSKAEAKAASEKAAKEKAESEAAASKKAEEEKAIADSQRAASEAAAKIEAEIETEKKYREDCIEVSYKDLCRYPEKYEGTKIVVKVKVWQIIDVNFSGTEKAWRTYTDNSGYGYYSDDEYYMLDKRGGDAVKILEDDIITVYGEFTGLEKITRALTSTTNELPRIEVKYADLVDE
jgi:hypothetical protein